MAWVSNDAFARLSTKGGLGYPRLPESRYVLELELTMNKGGDVEIKTAGDPSNSCHVHYNWTDNGPMIKCSLTHWLNGFWHWATEPYRDLAPGMPISVKLVVGDGL